MTLPCVEDPNLDRQDPEMVDSNDNNPPYIPHADDPPEMEQAADTLPARDAKGVVI
jgi:hypothetical protein